MDFFLSLFIFVFGLIVGSFINCVVYRLESGKSFLRGRSYCPNCKHGLNWNDLIPVFSFLYLKGRCRYCGNKISAQYPIVEISTGIIFIMIFNFQFLSFKEFSVFNFQNIIYLLFLLVVASFLMIIFVFDLKHFIIPDKVLYPLIAIVFLYRVYFLIIGHLVFFRYSGLGVGYSNLTNYLLSALFASAFFWGIIFLTKGKGMGMGDAKFAVFMGLFLGFPDILVALFFAFSIGAIIGIMLMAFKKKKLKSEIPFGPFLIIGTAIAFLWGSPIVSWYLGLSGF